MTEMSTLTVGDQEYEVVDASARASLSGKSDAGHTHSYSDIEETIPISKGGTGATTASGARTNLGLDGLTCKTYEVAPNTTAKMTFTSNTNVIIMATGSAGKSFATLVYIGYGIGGPNRAHIAELQLGESVTYALSAEDAEGNTHGLTITNANEDNKLYVSVLMLRGGLPTVTTV